MKTLIIAARRYNGRQLWTALGIMQSRGHTAEVASTAYEITDEVTGHRNIVKWLVPDIVSSMPYDALMIISGNHEDTEAYWHMPKVRALVKEFDAADKPIAAICAAVPAIRAAAFGKRVSFFPLVQSRILLEEAGAILCGTSVTVDGKLVTAEHEMAAQMWAESFCDVLENKRPSLTLKETGFQPGKIERKPMPALEHLKDITNRTGKTHVQKDDK